jgi:DNA-binding NarL/FixJ family response regulator
MQSIEPNFEKSQDDADVVVFSNHALFAYTLRKLLQENTSLKAAFLPVCAAYCPRLSPQFSGLLVMSIDPCDASTVPLIARLRESLPQARLLAALLPTVGSLPLSSLQQQVDSIWTDRSSLTELLEAVIMTLKGGNWFTREQVWAEAKGGMGAVGSVAGVRQAQLTTRELQILALMHQGRSNKWIAEHLFLSVSTVKNHLSHIFDKLGAANRRTAVLKAVELGLLPQVGQPEVLFEEPGLQGPQ